MSSRKTMKTVLVIDDNPTIVELIKYAINLHGSYRVLVAYDGVQGLERVYADQPDCVVIDVKMPRMDGYQLVRRLRSDAHTKNTPLIILSALTREEDQMTGLLLGADAYLTKPFKPNALNAAIERVLHLTPADRLPGAEGPIQRQTEP
jgi:DNA-binding response OmpR family regulator